jgi:hypothetical protein
MYGNSGLKLPKMAKATQEKGNALWYPGSTLVMRMLYMQAPLQWDNSKRYSKEA